jgi:hypothetical protein
MYHFFFVTLCSGLGGAFEFEVYYCFFFFFQFSGVTSHGVVMATSYVLGEHAEKIVAAITLKMLQAKYVDVQTHR